MVGYSSDKVDLIREFYQPAMSRATEYDRSVGYFSSGALALISGGIRDLYLRNGKLRLIASPVLSPDDIAAIRKGHSSSASVIEDRLLEYLDHRRLDTDQSLRLQLLSGMLADGLLELRLAVREREDGALGLYHEKIGIFRDEQEDYITFIGSPNESWNGWVGNAESFGLNTSWGPDHMHAEHWRDHFKATWSSDREGVVLRDFPTAVRDELFKRFPPVEPKTGGGIESKRSPLTGSPELPGWLQGPNGLREYQKEAINAWLAADGRGIFAMATGTGKTITALAAATQLWKALAERKSSLLVLVVVPSKDLVAQWRSSAATFGFTAVECHSGTGSVWPGRVQSALHRLAYASSAVEMVIATAGTLVARLQGEVSGYDGATLLVGDEMHSLGTEQRISALPDAKYRLGLSATPRRHGDEEGTEALVRYFGEILQSIDISEAIRLKALVPYDYHAIVVRLSSDELVKYKELSAKIAAAIGSSTNGEDALGSAKHLLIKRARLLGHAEAKTLALRELMRPRSASNFNLVYVAEGTHPITDRRQLEDVKHLLGTELGMKVHPYTSATSTRKRKELQLMLRKGELQGLIAMKCLDEGVDIPEARFGIILASTRNPRQFVQRRGRILRRDDEGGKHFAVLYDFLVLPDCPPEKSDPSFKSERRLVGRELTRALELASASRNGRDAPPAVLREAMEAYDLLELFAEYHQSNTWSAKDNNVYRT